MSAIFDFFNQGWVGAVIGVVGVILALIGLVTGYYFYRRSRQGAQLAYHHWTARVLGAHGHILPEAVKITFKDQPIENLCRSLILIWNNSDKTIDGKNIVTTDPLRIDMGKGVRVLDDRIVKITREVNNCGLGALVDLDSDEFPQPTIEFDYLDADDGCVVEVFHTDGAKRPTLRGSIREMPKSFKNYERRFPLVQQARIAYLGLAVIGAFILIGGIAQLPQGRVSGGLLLAAIGAVVMVALIANLLTKRRRYPKALSMPEFTSN